MDSNNIRKMQQDIFDWINYNFGMDNELATVGGLMEEAGELIRAAVKRSQGIRGTREEWDAEIRKEAGDVFVKLCDVASFYGFDLADAIGDRWAEVSKRDWKKDSIGHGLPSDDN